jgi:integrase/recombinase XerD
MTPIAPFISEFLRDYLPIQHGSSPHTIETYAQAFRLLFAFASKTTKQKPSQLCVEQIDANLILGFLTDLEQRRGNGPTTRNARLAAINSFMAFVEFKLPALLEQVRQIRQIPRKRYDQPLPRHLTMDEIQPILNAPNISTRLGIRDRAMMHLCFTAGLRVSELVGLTLADLSFNRVSSISVTGKGRKQRCLPLEKPAATDIRAWLAVRGNVKAPELFVNSQGTAMTRAGFEYILDKHARTAAEKIPSLKNRSVSPHQLRHSCAVRTLQATHDTRKVAIWLGHSDVRTTEIYLRLDPSEKLEAVEAVLPPHLRRGRFKAPDALIASLLGGDYAESIRRKNIRAEIFQSANSA